MQPKGLPRLLSAVLVLVLALANAPSAAAYDAKLPGGYLLGIEVPSGWHVEKQAGPHSVTLRLLTSKRSKHPTVQITAFALPAEQAPHSAAEVQGMVERRGKDILHTALQSSLEVKPLPIAEGSAYYYHLTDRKEERDEGDFRELHQGIGEIGGHAFTFTVLTHPGEEQLVTTSLASLSSVTISKR